MAANDEGHEKDKSAKKSKTTMFLAIGIVVAIAVAATFGVLFFTSGSKAETGKTDKVEAKATSTCALDPFIVNIYDGQDMRYLRLKVEMGVAGEEATNQIKNNEARIRDSILTLLTSKTWAGPSDTPGEDTAERSDLEHCFENCPARYRATGVFHGFRGSIIFSLKKTSVRWPENRTAGADCSEVLPWKKF